jgi:hypothetical protein
MRKVRTKFWWRNSSKAAASKPKEEEQFYITLITIQLIHQPTNVLTKTEFIVF